MENPAYQHVYNVGLLDDIHNYFPAILYDQGRFQTLPTLFSYIRHQMNTRFNLYSYGASLAGARIPTPVSFGATGPSWQSGMAGMPGMPGMVGATWVSGTAGPVGATGSAGTRHSAEQDMLESIASVNLLLNLLQPNPARAGVSEFMPASRILRTRAPNMDVMAAFRSPVIIAPSQEILAANTQLIMGSDLSSNTVCSVCQDIIGIGEGCRRIRVCQHVYHRTCIDEWFSRSVFCPSCRHDIRDASPRLQAAVPPIPPMPPMPPMHLTASSPQLTETPVTSNPPSSPESSQDDSLFQALGFR